MFDFLQQSINEIHLERIILIKNSNLCILKKVKEIVTPQNSAFSFITLYSPFIFFQFTFKVLLQPSCLHEIFRATK